MERGQRHRRRDNFLESQLESALFPTVWLAELESRSGCSFTAVWLVLNFSSILMELSAWSRLYCLTKLASLSIILFFEVC